MSDALRLQPFVSDEVPVNARSRLPRALSRAALATLPALLAPVTVALAGCPDLTPLGPDGDGTGEPDARPDGPDGPDEPDPDTPLVADIDVDTNRDGVIDGADDAREDLFDATAGAVFFANVDDDDGDGERDRNDDVLGSEADELADLTTVRISGVLGLTNAHVVTLAMDPPPALERVRVC
jgi:hypothetical protein